MIGPNHIEAAKVAIQKAYGPTNSLPPTDNRWILESAVSLYTPTLFSASQALFQHTLVLAVLFLLRGFSSKRLLDLHFLTIGFATTMIVAPFIFLIDVKVGRLKLLFFLEHEAVEVLIAVRVLAPSQIVARRPGLLIFLLYSLLVGLSVFVVVDDFFSHSADVVAWGAFTSDFLLGLSGIFMIKRWMKSRNRELSKAARKKQQAEAMTGLGFMLHGFPTMCIAPIFTLVMYDKLNPAWFAYGWVVVWVTGFFAIAFAVPSACLFFSNVWWCCGSRRAVFPGQVEWQEDFIQEEARHSGPVLYEPPATLIPSDSTVNDLQIGAVPASLCHSYAEWKVL